jgi:hypothetical protein
MERESGNQLIGAIQLAQDAVEGVTTVALTLQDEIGQVPYTLLRGVKPLTPVVDLVAAVQELTSLVSYRSVPIIGRAVGDLMKMGIIALQNRNAIMADSPPIDSISRRQ